MTKREHRLGVTEVNLVTRHLKLGVESITEKALFAAIEEIDKIYGLDTISFDEKSQVLNLSYDASRTCIDGIEDILTRHGLSISHDWWTHFKEGYYRFVDENIKNNASHEPWSCHKNPPGR